MKTTAFPISALVLAGTLHVLAAGHPAEEFKTSAGPLKITPIMHAALMIEAGGQVIQVDPAQGNFDGLPPADIVLVTDIHGDHMVPASIDKVKKPNATIIAPAAVAKTVTTATVMNNGDKKTVGPFTIEAIAMYNLKPDDKGQTYHEKGRGNGYVLTYGGFRIYIAGDTEGIPEMLALKNIDVAFIPMNLPYTMTPPARLVAFKGFPPKRVSPITTAVQLEIFFSGPLLLESTFASGFGRHSSEEGGKLCGLPCPGWAWGGRGGWSDRRAAAARGPRRRPHPRPISKRSHVSRFRRSTAIFPFQACASRSRSFATSGA